MRVASRDQIPTIELERTLQSSGFRSIAGVDEVGRGSWAGPLVAAAVILPLEASDLPIVLTGVRDSKLLEARERDELAVIIWQICTAAAVGRVSAAVIDHVGISRATRIAMGRAVQHLAVVPQALILDAFALPGSHLPQISFPRADGSSLSVAAASIIAKVHRDRSMVRYGKEFPEYGFDHHKGYGTSFHQGALLRYGPCKLHRRSFAPISRFAS